MSDFTRTLYADLLDGEDHDDLDRSLEEWSLMSPSERSFAQLQLLWLIHGQMSEMTAETTTLSSVLRSMGLPDASEAMEPEVVDVEVVDD